MKVTEGTDTDTDTGEDTNKDTDTHSNTHTYLGGVTVSSYALIPVCAVTQALRCGEELRAGCMYACYTHTLSLSHVTSILSMLGHTVLPELRCGVKSVG